MSMVRVFVVTLIAALVASSALAGCVVVRPHERQTLAKRSMTSDRGRGERRADLHRAGAREGADGGTGEPGGGCGCN